jgi:hypothetical protein
MKLKDLKDLVASIDEEVNRLGFDEDNTEVKFNNKSKGGLKHAKV